MPNPSEMIPVSIPDPAFIKRKVFLAWDTGDDHVGFDLNYVVSFCLRGGGYCKNPGPTCSSIPATVITIVTCICSSSIHP